MKHSFEDQFKKAMDTAEEPLNVDKLWAAVESRTFAKRKRPWLVWFALPILLLSFFALGYSLSHFNEAEYTSEDVLHESDSPITKVTKDTAIEEENSLENELRTAENKGINKELIDTKEAQEVTTLAKEQAVSLNSNHKQTRRVDEGAEVVISNVHPVSIENDRTSEAVHLMQGNKDPIRTEPIQQVSKTGMQSPSRLMDQLVKISYTPFELFETTRENTVFIDSARMVPLEIVSAEPLWYSSLLLSSSYGRSQRNLSNPDGLSQDYLATRQSTESPRESWTVSTGMLWRHQKGLLLEAGIQYQRINEQFNWSGSYVEKDDEIYKDLLIINENGDSIRMASAGSTELTQTIITRNMSINNSYQQLSIQAGIGYSFPMGQWRIEPLFYTQLNAITWVGQSDYILLEDNSPAFLRDQIRNDVSVSLAGKLGLHYQCTEQYSLGLQGGFRTIPNVLAASSSIVQKYQFIGAGLQLQRRF